MLPPTTFKPLKCQLKCQWKIFKYIFIGDSKNLKNKNKSSNWNNALSITNSHISCMVTYKIVYNTKQTIWNKRSETFYITFLDSI